jgi:protein-disulfide isomerase
MTTNRFTVLLRRRSTVALLGLALTSAGITLGAQTVLAQSGRAAPAWTAMVRTGEQGSHIMGNPAARVRLAEYVSYTCPHCAHFAAEATQTLRADYVARGTVSVEVRHVVRDPVDLAMASATNCGAPARFFARHESMMGQHEAIMERVRALPQTTLQQWGALPMAQRLRRVADDSGVTAWMRGRGFTPAQINQCLGNTALAERLIDQSNQAATVGVQGTPSFTINGTLVPNAYSWTALRPALDAALAR